MLKKAWEVLVLLVISIVFINIIAASIKPYLPLLGLTVVLIIICWLVHVVFIRKKFW